MVIDVIDTTAIYDPEYETGYNHGVADRGKKQTERFIHQIRSEPNMQTMVFLQGYYDGFFEKSKHNSYKIKGITPVQMDVITIDRNDILDNFLREIKAATGLSSDQEIIKLSLFHLWNNTKLNRVRMDSVIIRNNMLIEKQKKDKGMDNVKQSLLSPPPPGSSQDQ